MRDAASPPFQPVQIQGQLSGKSLGVGLYVLEAAALVIPCIRASTFLFWLQGTDFELALSSDHPFPLPYPRRPQRPQRLSSAQLRKFSHSGLYILPYRLDGAAKLRSLSQLSFQRLETFSPVFNPFTLRRSHSRTQSHGPSFILLQNSPKSTVASIAFTIKDSNEQ